MTIRNDDSRVVNNLEASLTGDARVVIYDRHMFIVQATGDYPTACGIINLSEILDKDENKRYSLLRISLKYTRMCFTTFVHPAGG